MIDAAGEGRGVAFGCCDEILRDERGGERHRLEGDDRHQVAGVRAGDLAAAPLSLRRSAFPDGKTAGAGLRGLRLVPHRLMAGGWWLARRRLSLRLRVPVRRLARVGPGAEIEAEDREEEQGEDDASHRCERYHIALVSSLWNHRARPSQTPWVMLDEISARATTESAQQNIETIARLEHEAIEHRGLGERLSDAFTRVMGSMTFVSLHVAGFLVWFAVNLGLIPGVEPFDPFPFGILTLIVSAEGVLLAIFVLISQNRASRLANQRAHLNLQISLLSEQESTKLLQKIQTIANHLGIEETADDHVAQRLSQSTHLEVLAEELKKSLPDD